jgi:hypothetical protein
MVSVEMARALERGDRLVLARRWPSDWGLPQADNPSSLDFLTVRAASGMPLRWWTEVVYPWHPVDHVLSVEALGPGAAGDRIELRFGDGAQGSPGARVQTFIEEACSACESASAPTAVGPRSVGSRWR